MKPTYTKNVKIIKGVIANSEKYNEAQISELINVVDKWINTMPEVLSNGLFTANRKIILSDLLMKLQMIRINKQVI